MKSHTLDNLKNGTISKLAAKVSEYYGDALTSAIESKGAGGVWPLFGFPPVCLFSLLSTSELIQPFVAGNCQLSNDQEIAFRCCCSVQKECG